MDVGEVCSCGEKKKSCWLYSVPLISSFFSWIFCSRIFFFQNRCMLCSMKFCLSRHLGSSFHHCIRGIQKCEKGVEMDLCLFFAFACPPLVCKIDTCLGQNRAFLTLLFCYFWLRPSEVLVGAVLIPTRGLRGTDEWKMLMRGLLLAKPSKASLPLSILAHQDYSYVPVQAYALVFC